jgi:hypothetical protein
MNWYTNNVGAKPKPDNAVMTKNYAKKNLSMRDIISKTHPEQIQAIIATKTTAKPGDPQWLSHYPNALTTVLASLTKEEREEAERKVKGWAETGAPREIQRL